MALDESFWQNHYKSQFTPWDAGSITLPLQTYLEKLPDKSLKILVPGGGNSYEAEFLFRRGFKHVYVADIAKEPLQNLQKRVPNFPPNQLIHQNFFNLNQDFDLIIEQTFFCALNPALRPAYAQKCSELLRPGGILAGVLFDTQFSQPGPPFGGSAAEYRVYFAPYFTFKHFERCYNSILPRQGRELFIELQKNIPPAN